MNAETPPAGWTLNEPSYMARVAGLIEHGLIDFVTKAHLHPFLERLRKAELRRSRQELDFWTKADPWIDVWMLLTKRQRQVFDITAFVDHHPGISRSLQYLRTAANLRVLSDRCPVAREMERQRRQAHGERTPTSSVTVLLDCCQTLDALGTLKNCKDCVTSYILTIKYSLKVTNIKMTVFDNTVL